MKIAVAVLVGLLAAYAGVYYAPLAIVSGLIVTLLVANISLPYLLDQVKTRSLALNGINKERWDRVIECRHVAKGNRTLGFLEVVLYFACLVMKAHGALAGLLAFKVASKWAVWQHIEKVPDKFTGGASDTEAASDFDNWAVRDALATRFLQRFLIGTFGNLLSAVVGYVVYRLLFTVSH